MQTTDKKDWATRVARSGYLDSQFCRDHQRGHVTGVVRLIERCRDGAILSEGELIAIHETHRLYKLWSIKNKLAWATFPPDLQAQMDAMSKRRKRRSEAQQKEMQT